MATLGGATFQAPYALPGSKPVNATNKITPVISNTGSTLGQANGGFLGAGASGSWASAIPAPQQSQPVAYLDTGGNTYGSAGAPSGGAVDYSAAATSAPAYDPAYDLYAGQANDALSRALNAFNSTTGNINQTYGQKNNELQSSKAANTADYNTGLTTQDQTRLGNFNQIHQGANQGYQSLLRILGGMGAGDGSEAQYLVPELVGQQLNQQLGGADETAATNKRVLTTTYNKYLDQEKNQEAQLNDWKGQQLAQAGAVYDTTKSNLSNLLAALQNHSDTAQNLGSQVGSIAAGIPVALNYTPSYTGSTPVYTPPALSTFETPNMPTAQVQQNQAGGTNPLTYLNLITGQDKKQQQTA